MARFKQNNRRSMQPMDIGYYIANQLLLEGAQIDEIHDLPLTTTIRFTMKINTFKNRVSPLIAWNLDGNIDEKLGQVIESEQLTGDVWQYKVMWIKAFFVEEARQLAS